MRPHDLTNGKQGKMIDTACVAHACTFRPLELVAVLASD